MAEQRSGLRFDIYERVHLPDGLAGIMEFEGAELVPHIRVQEERDQAVIKGNLWLTGTYVSEGGEKEQSLEHLIPVEITLPFNRVNRLEDIAVEIEQFDVDLLSSRTINITGVLSLHGIGRGEETWSEEADEKEERGAAESGFQAGLQEEAFSENPEYQEMDFPESANGHLPVLESDPGLSPEAVPVGLPIWEAAAPPPKSESIEAAAPAPEPQAEIKIAYGGKPEPLAPLGHLKSIARRDKPEESGNAHKTEQAEQNADALEWKKLFIGEESGRDRFKTKKICIVQKEETIEQIAQRYRMNPREIMLFNRLQSQQVGAGQIIYIP